MTYNFLVPSNEMACRKRGRLVLDPIQYHCTFIRYFYFQYQNNLGWIDLSLLIESVLVICINLQSIGYHYFVSMIILYSFMVANHQRRRGYQLLQKLEEGLLPPDPFLKITTGCTKILIYYSQFIPVEFFLPSMVYFNPIASIKIYGMDFKMYFP